MEKLTMKQKLKKLDQLISVKGADLATKLSPDGKPYKEVNLEDVELERERDFIMKML
jgi:roadblock/LC7 domain-containing protein